MSFRFLFDQYLNLLFYVKNKTIDAMDVFFFSSEWFRSTDLQVMSLTRFLCATLLYNIGFFEFSFSIGIQGIEPCLADQKVLPCFLYTIRLPRLLFWRNHSFFLGFEPNHNIRNTPYCFPNDCLYGAITPMDIPGIEPGFTAHKTVVLPLYYTSAYQWWGSNPRSLRRGS